MSQHLTWPQLHGVWLRQTVADKVLAHPVYCLIGQTVACCLCGVTLKIIHSFIHSYLNHFAQYAAVAAWFASAKFFLKCCDHALFLAQGRALGLEAVTRKISPTQKWPPGPILAAKNGPILPKLVQAVSLSLPLCPLSLSLCLCIHLPSKSAHPPFYLRHGN